ncbi:MAG: penicillin acylase family protein [Myxococcota bacterium]
MRRTRWAILATSLFLTAVPLACSDDDDGGGSAPQPDAGADAPVETGADAAPDATPDAAPDATTDVTPDASSSGISIDGLSAPVSVVYDEHGIPHVTCATDDDCFAAIGYVHASNRLFTMDFLRHLIRGKLASLVAAGSLILESDYYYRQFMADRNGDPLPEVLLADLDAESAHVLDRYAAGVNAWIHDVNAGANGAELSVEYDFYLLADRDIPPWEPEDSLAVALYLINDLSNSIDTELALAQMATLAPPTIAADLLTMQPAFPVFTIPAAGETFDAPLPASPHPGTLAYERLSPFASVLHQARAFTASAVMPHSDVMSGSKGSNNWVLAPSRTSAGHAILANDPHLGMSNPAVFLPMEIDSMSEGSGTLHVAGGTVPGLPPVLTGHNEHVAWGVTTANLDLNEVYLETLTPSGDGVMFEGSEVPFVTRVVTFENALGDPVDKELKWVPHHGPVLAEDPQNGTAITARWVPHDGMNDVRGYFELQRAASVAEAKAALSQLDGSNQNFVVCDLEGNIGWYPFSRLPARSWASMALPSWLPVPGDGSAEWDAFLDVSELPQLTNPSNGFVATANQGLTGATADGDPTNDGHPVYQGWQRNFGARMKRIVDVIEAGGDAHDVQSMLDLQADTYSVLGEVLAPMMVQAASGATLDAVETAVVDALDAWAYTCPTGLEGFDPEGAKDPDPVAARESIGCMAFHITLYALMNRAFGDEASFEDPTGGELWAWEKAVLNVILLDQLDPAALPSGGAFWDDVDTAPTETREEIAVLAVGDAAAHLATISADPDDWRWGRFHTLSFTSIYASFGITQFDNGPFANDGALYTVDVATPVGGTDMRQGWGPTVRSVIEATPSGMVMHFQHAGGTTLDRDSPFYDQLVDEWLRNEAIVFPFGPGAVSSPAQELELVPSGS